MGVTHAASREYHETRRAPFRPLTTIVYQTYVGVVHLGFVTWRGVLIFGVCELYAFWCLAHPSCVKGGA